MTENSKMVSRTFFAMGPVVTMSVPAEASAECRPMEGRKPTIAKLAGYAGIRQGRYRRLRARCLLLTQQLRHRCYLRAFYLGPMDYRYDHRAGCNMGAKAELWHIGVPNEDRPREDAGKFIILRFDGPRKSG